MMFGRKKKDKSTEKSRKSKKGEALGIPPPIPNELSYHHEETGKKRGLFGKGSNSFAKRSDCERKSENAAGDHLSKDDLSSLSGESMNSRNSPLLTTKKSILKSKGLKSKAVNLDDDSLLERNTIANEVINMSLTDTKMRNTSIVNGSALESLLVKSPNSDHSSTTLAELPNHNFDAKSNGISRKLFERSADESQMTLDVLEPVIPTALLTLPVLRSPSLPEPRILTVMRNSQNEFGFSLRKSCLYYHYPNETGGSTKIQIHFAETADLQKGAVIDLNPGDRLIEVNRRNVTLLNAEELVDIIRTSGREIQLTVQTTAEFIELSGRKTTPSPTQPGVDGMVWVSHSRGFTAAKLSQFEDRNVDEVAVEICGKKFTVSEMFVEKCNSVEQDFICNLSSLNRLNECSLLHILRMRFASNLIHTYVADDLLVVNPMHPLTIYTDRVANSIKNNNSKAAQQTAHIYVVAKRAYTNAIMSRKNQAIVTLGYSGSGKTTTVRHIVQYYAMTCGFSDDMELSDKLHNAFLLLEAFGNAKTSLNASGSRFSLACSLDFTSMGQICGSTFHTLLLDSSRIVNRSAAEGPFLIFNQLISGCEPSQRPNLYLTSADLLPTNSFFTIFTKDDEKQYATRGWGYTLSAASRLHISDEEISALSSVLSAIIHLGIAGVVTDSNGRQFYRHVESAQKAASLLGCSYDSLTQLLFDASKGDGMLALSSFVSSLYQSVFDIVVYLINRALAPLKTPNVSIVVTDIPGFQNVSHNDKDSGASIQDLYYNYAYERFHALHIDKLTQLSALYKQETIKLPDDVYMSASSSANLLSALDRPRNSTQETCGLLWIIEEESLSPGTPSSTVVDRMISYYDGELVRQIGNQLCLNHLQQSIPINYDVSDWLTTTRQHLAGKQALPLLQDSERAQIAGLFSSLIPAMKNSDSTTSIRRTSSIRKNLHSNVKRKSIAIQVKFQTDRLLEFIKRCKLHFIHCLIPKTKAGFAQQNKQIGEPMSVPLVKTQIRSLRLLDALRIHKYGYPVAFGFVELQRNFSCILPVKKAQSVNPKFVAVDILEQLEVSANSYKVGLTKVFLREGCLDESMAMRDKYVHETITAFQALIRGNASRLKFRKMQKQLLAITCLQRNVRKYLKIREWPWWKLFVQVLPLVKVQSSSADLESVTKLETASKENAQLKSEMKSLRDVIYDLEHTIEHERQGAGYDSDLLETEQIERLKLEKEVKTLRGKVTKQNLSIDHLKLEISELQMIRSSMDENVSSDEAEDVLWREKYNRLRRDNEVTVRQLKQDHDEQYMRLSFANKSVTKKLQVTLEESEDNKANSKLCRNKLDRANIEVNDLRVLLEKTEERNETLERNQKKIDTTVGRIEEEARIERRDKEKCRSELDKIKSENYVLRQEMKGKETEIYDLCQKCSHLESDLSVFTGSSDTGKVSERDIVNLKKRIQELELKMADQEEELDDQAIKIQTLEQEKLRIQVDNDRLKRQTLKDQESRDDEADQTRVTYIKKIRDLDILVEELENDKRKSDKERRLLESTVRDLEHCKPMQDVGVEAKLRKDLRRTRALLKNAQSVINNASQNSAPGKQQIKLLRNHIEDLQEEISVNQRQRKNVEDDLEDAKTEAETLTMSKAVLEEKLKLQLHEVANLSDQLDDGDEQIEDLLKTQKTLVQQVSAERDRIAACTEQVHSLKIERDHLQGELDSERSHSRISGTKNPSNDLFEIKIQELVNQLDMEKSTRRQSDVMLDRLRNQISKLDTQIATLSQTESKLTAENSTLQRKLRDCASATSDNRDHDLVKLKQGLELRVNELEYENRRTEAELQDAVRQLTSLRAAMNDGSSVDGDSDVESDRSASESNSENDHDGDINDFLAKYGRSPLMDESN